MESRIVVVGSLNADFVINMHRFPEPGETVVGKDFTIFPGGKGANQAYGVAKLGGYVSMVGQVGNDAQGPWLRQHLASAGVDVSHVREDKAVSSGIALISIDASGQNQIVMVPGSNSTFSVEILEQSRDLIASAKLVLLQLEIPLGTVETAARYAKAAGALIILDPAPAVEISDELLAIIDYLTPNETEFVALTGGTRLNDKFFRREVALRAHKLRMRGAKKVIVKMGSLGALLVAESQEHFWPAVPVVAVDTTAAGDAFNAAFAFALATGKMDLEAGRFATAAAACSVTRRGAQLSMPTFDEVENLLA